MMMKIWIKCTESRGDFQCKRCNS